MRPEEIPSYPHLGHIYPGDYLENIPYVAYIDGSQPLPEGKYEAVITDSDVKATRAGKAAPP